MKPAFILKIFEMVCSHAIYLYILKHAVKYLCSFFPSWDWEFFFQMNKYVDR